MAEPSILITGAAGYIGRLLVGALAARRKDISALVALDWSAVADAKKLEGVTYEQTDICDPSLASMLRTHRIDTVVHLASIVRTPSNAPKNLAYKVDVLGTRNVLEACRAAQVRRIVVTSSGAAYGYYADNPEWLDEADPLRGNNAFEYARNKRQVEMMLAQWRKDYPELHQVVFRPGTIVGASVHSPVTDLFERPVLLGVAGSESPFVFIWDEDLVACLVEAVWSNKVGVYNVAGDGALTPLTIAAMLRKPYLPIPASVLSAILWVLKKLHLTESGPERVDFLRYRPVLSNRRLKQEFGYTPRLTSRAAFELYARARGLMPAPADSS